MRRLKSYSRTSLRFQSVGGQRVLSSHQQLRSLVVKRLQQSGIADLFSIPEEDGEKQEFVWYTDLPGQITAFPELAEEARQQRSKELGEKFEALRVLAGELRSNAAAGRRSLEADIIEAALNVPDDSCKFVVGDQLVVAAWGASLTTTTRPAVDVIWKGEASPERPVAGVPDSVASADGEKSAIQPRPARSIANGGSTRKAINWTWLRGWLIWLIPLILLVLAALLLFRFGFPWPRFAVERGLESTAVPTIADQGEAGDAGLRREIADLKRKLEEKLAACTPLKKSELPSKTGKGEGQRLAIPSDAAAKRDLSSLSGCWNSPSVPVTINAGSAREESDVAEVVLCFSPDGKTGKRTVKTAKMSCEGSLAAAFKNDNVAIDAPTMTCTDQSLFSSAAITCRPADADTACEFAQENNPNSVKVVFTKRPTP